MSTPTVTGRGGYRSRPTTNRDFDPEADNWKTQAACRGQDPDYWFPERRGDDKFGKRICGNCPVRETCLAYALANREMHGTWGGMSAWERAELQGRRVY